MLDHFVTIPWLLGTAIGICAIIVPLLVLWSRSKVNKETCELMHASIDRALNNFNSRLNSIDDKIENIRTSIIRIETTLNGKHTTTGASGR